MSMIHTVVCDSSNRSTIVHVYDTRNAADQDAAIRNANAIAANHYDFVYSVDSFSVATEMKCELAPGVTITDDDLHMHFPELV